MSTLLIRNATLLATMDNTRREIRGGGVFARDGVIEAVGSASELPQSADQVLNLDGYLVLPGLVNCHHHLYQTLTRAVPGTQDAVLFDWLRTLYPIWARLTPEAMYTSSLVGMAELILSGCTTASDHHYIYPNGCKLDDQIRAAREIGIRFHASRGSMSLGESRGGLPPDRCVEDEAAILKETERLIQEYHDPRPYAMMRIVVAPCSPFSVSPELMRESAALARAYKVRLHTHLAETHDEEVFCLERFGRRPVDYAADLDWAGPDVWYAHVVHVNSSEITRMAAGGSGVAHCPSSNMRLASGIAPIKAMLAAGVKVGLGVDGSASNDGSHLLAEARQAMLLQRVSGDPCALTARQALELATRGGAAVLGRDDIGALEPGRSADLVALRLDRLAYAGALHDPLAAAVFCAPQGVDYSVINGRVIVDQGHLTTIDLGPVVERHNRISLEMIQGR